MVYLRRSLRLKISEDWLSVAIGFIIIALIVIGAITWVPWRFV